MFKINSNVEGRRDKTGKKVRFKRRDSYSYDLKPIEEDQHNEMDNPNNFKNTQKVGRYKYYCLANL